MSARSRLGRAGFALMAATALCAGPVAAQSDEFDEETGLYVICVKQLMLDGAIAYHKKYGRIASDRNLVISAIELCGKQRVAAARSIMEDNSASAQREGQQVLDEVLNPHFMGFARDLNRKLRGVRW